MRYEYTLTYKDYLDAQKLYRSHVWTAALSYYVWIWAVPIIGLTLALSWFVTMSGYSLEWLASMAGFAGVGIWLGLFIPAARVYTIRKCWKRLLPESVPKSTKTSIAVEFEMTEDQVISVLPGRSEGRFFWTALFDLAEDDKLTLLFIKKRQFLFIPLRALDEAGWNLLRSKFASSRAKS